jgi:hypothetical protein
MTSFGANCLSFLIWNLGFQMEQVLDEVSTRDFAVEATTILLCRKNTEAYHDTQNGKTRGYGI